jgi:lysophospholipase L1-like esterase
MSVGKKIQTRTKKAKFIFIFFVLSFSSFGQAELAQYPFIKVEENRLHFSKDSSSFIRFCKKLDEYKQGNRKRLSVVHIGGSHVQGGTWSNTFASNFQRQMNTRGGGYFAFPYKIAKTNGQPYVRTFSNGKWKRCRSIGKDFCQPLGMCALNVSTNDSSNYFGAALTRFAMCSKANVIKVFHNFNRSYSIAIKDEPALVGKDVEASGYTEFVLPQAKDSVIVELLRKDTTKKDFILYGLSLENDLEQGIYLAGLGANGASSVSFLRCQYLVPQLQSLEADIIVLSLGVNDTQSKGFDKEDYIEHYDSLITAVRRASPEALILLTTTTDNYIRRKTSNKRTITAQEAMFELMEKHHVAVWDLFKIMGGYKSMARWTKAGLAARDKVHFTPKGYTILGDMMFAAVMRSYQINSKTQ